MIVDFKGKAVRKRMVAVLSAAPAGPRGAPTSSDCLSPHPKSSGQDGRSRFPLTVFFLRSSKPFPNFFSSPLGGRLHLGLSRCECAAERAVALHVARELPSELGVQSLRCPHVAQRRGERGILG